MYRTWMKNDALRFVRETNVNSRTFAETLLGSVSFMIKDAAIDFGVLTGITH